MQILPLDHPSFLRSKHAYHAHDKNVLNPFRKIVANLVSIRVNIFIRDPEEHVLENLRQKMKSQFGKF